MGLCRILSYSDCMLEALNGGLPAEQSRVEAFQKSNVGWMQRISTGTTATAKPTAQTERSSPVNSSNAMTPTAHQSTSLPATTEGVECHAARRICFATALRNEPLGTGMQGRKRRGETAEGTGKEFDLP